MAHLEPRGAAFRVRWRAGRSSPWENCTFPTEKEAKAAKQLAETRNHKISSSEVYKVILGIVDEKPAEDLTPKLRDWIEQWISLKVDIAPSTHAEYARLLRGRVVPELGKVRLAELTREDHIDPFKAKLAQELMPAGVRKHYAVLSQVLRDAVPKYRPDNPCDRLPGRRSNGLPKVEKYDACFLTPDESDLLLAKCPDAIKDFVTTGLLTGMRLGELVGLRVRAVDIFASDPVIYVEQNLRKNGTFGSPKSVKSRRAISIPDSLVALLKPRIVGKPREALVFPSPDGGKWDTSNLRRRYWKPAVAAAGRCVEHPPEQVPCGRGGELRMDDPLAVSSCQCPTRLHQQPRIHDLRHTHVGWLIDDRWDFFAIQLRIGHASIKTTFDVYGHRLPGGDKKNLKALDVRVTGKTVKKSKKSKAKQRKKQVVESRQAQGLADAA
jgi:integrase